MCLLCGRTVHRNFCFFFFNDTATTEIYTLSLHDALPISKRDPDVKVLFGGGTSDTDGYFIERSEEHTSELQSQSNLVCRLLLEKKKKKPKPSLHNPVPTADVPRDHDADAPQPDMSTTQGI